MYIYILASYSSSKASRYSIISYDYNFSAYRFQLAGYRDEQEYLEFHKGKGVGFVEKRSNTYFKLKLYVYVW